jgi:YidC/Oxa1 family membrane protein insertase
LGPQPADPQQAKIMMIMPVMFTYLFASFPAGLVIYWAWSNILTILQQLYINHRSDLDKAKRVATIRKKR